MVLLKCSPRKQRPSKPAPIPGMEKLSAVRLPLAQTMFPLETVLIEKTIMQRNLYKHRPLVVLDGSAWKHLFTDWTSCRINPPTVKDFFP